MDLAEKIKLLLQKQNRRQADLCRYTGIDPGYMSRLMNGKSRFNQDHMEKIAQFFHVSKAELFSNVIKEPYEIFYATNSQESIQIYAKAAALVEEIVRSEPRLPNDPEKKSRAIEKLYQHWLIEQEPPTLNLAKKYFIIA